MLSVTNIALYPHSRVIMTHVYETNDKTLKAKTKYVQFKQQCLEYRRFLVLLTKIPVRQRVIIVILIFIDVLPLFSFAAFML